MTGPRCAWSFLGDERDAKLLGFFDNPHYGAILAYLNDALPRRLFYGRVDFAVVRRTDGRDPIRRFSLAIMANGPVAATDGFVQSVRRIVSDEHGAVPLRLVSVAAWTPGDAPPEWPWDNPEALAADAKAYALLDADCRNPETVALLEGGGVVIRD